ncbi:MAG: energy transducer TonB [Rhodoferax sp.]
MTYWSLGDRKGYTRIRLWVMAIAGVIAGCATPPPPPPPVAVTPPPAPVVIAPPPPPAVVKAPEPVEAAPRVVSNAGTPKDYRRDAAAHLYEHMKDRIYKGKMPALLHAVGVLQVDIDRRGAVTDVRWMRAPHHAPEVMAEIERSVRAAAPYPAPVRMGGVTYTDTWLWHKTGRFQLDTLSEGQL